MSGRSISHTFRAVAARSVELDGHEESIDRSGIPEPRVDQGRLLTWRRGDKFPFDGANVPTIPERMGSRSPSLFGQVSRSASEAAADVLNYFKDTMLTDGAFPPIDEWHYWWRWIRRVV